MRMILRLLLVCLLPVSSGAFGLVGDFDGDGEPKVAASLVSSVVRAARGSDVEMLLRQKIAQGWHSYWTTPGDSGAPAELTFNAPEGVEVGDLSWPYPKRIPYGPLMNFGYEGEVLVPFTVSIPLDYAGASVDIGAKGRILVCADICIPQQVKFGISIPVGETAAGGPRADLFARASEFIPRRIPVAAAYRVTGGHIQALVELPFIRENRLTSIEYFPFAPEVIDNPAEQRYRFDESGLHFTLKPGHAFTRGADLSGVLVLKEESGGTLTSAFEITLEEAAPTTAGTAGAGLSLLTAVVFAFLGGLILNLMPCVFPVLSIKILSLLDKAGREGARLHGWVYSAGVLTSFVAVAAVLVALQAAGWAIGWGFQLQSPVLVALLAYLFVVIGLNLFGVFELGTSFMSLGGGRGRGLGASFATGVLATTVAAPCTAPFMGAAIGFALTQAPALGLLVFAFLGAGMAAPYLALCHSPSLLKRLPRSGAWMDGLKQLLAFPMFASAIWLVWVLGNQAGTDGMMQIMAGALSLSLAIRLLAFRSKSRLSSFLRILVAAGLIAGAGYAAIQQESRTPGAPAAVPYRAYSAQALATARKEGPVFVNFTAAWCITCKVNELSALSGDAFLSALEAKGVTYLRGDWTAQDPAITAALADYGRSGVPLYLLYRRGFARAEVLPQLLTEAIVLDAIESL